MSDPNSRLVFSTSIGRMCPGCGSSKESCRCGTAPHAPAALPRRLTARLRTEKAGRGGKMVTVVDGLPNNPAFLKDLSQELKRVCGTGGAVLDGGVQLQGDLRDRVRTVLIDKGFNVKG
jgi:translation initiation factor 1